MKKSIFKLLYVLPLAIGMCLTSCKDDDEMSPDPVSTTTACNGGDGFCMNYGGVEKSGSAKLTVQSANKKIRVYWESGTGSAFEQVELDVYSLTAGTFPVNDLATPNSAFVQYFATSGGVSNPAYGTVTVSTLDTIAGVTGTFNVTMKDSTKITNGVFRGIVK